MDFKRNFPETSISRQSKLHVEYPLQMLQQGNDFEYFMITEKTRFVNFSSKQCCDEVEGRDEKEEERSVS